MKTNITPVLYPAPNSKGECPLRVRITVSRVQKYISVDESVAPKFWNSQSHVVLRKHERSVVINEKIEAIILDIKKYVHLQEEVLKLPVTAVGIKDNFRKKPAADVKIFFFPFATKYIERFNNEQSIGTKTNYEQTIKIFEAFTDIKLTFADMTSEVMCEFLRSLRADEYFESTSRKIFTHLSTIFNQAKLELKTVQLIDDPFQALVFNETHAVPKDKLTEAEVNIIRQVNDKSVQLAKDIFLFAFNTGGMRIGDLSTLKWDNVANGHLTYIMRKNGKEQALELSSEALEILDRYKGGAFIFPLLSEADERSIRLQIIDATTRANRMMVKLAKVAGINKHITTHVSRHSFAEVALEKGVDMRALQSVFKHSSIKTTEGAYANPMAQKIISNVNLRVVRDEPQTSPQHEP